MKPFSVLIPAVCLLLLGFATQTFGADPLDSPQNADSARQQAIAAIRGLGGTVRPVSKSSPGLRVEFHLGGRDLKDDGLAHLAAVSDIVVLNLRDTSITGTGLVHLRGLARLSTLHLERTKVDDTAAESLAKLESLEYLNLYSTKITDKTLERLQGLKKLRRLYVWQTKVTDAGVSRLVKQRPALKVVRGVDLTKLAAYKQITRKEPQPKLTLKWIAAADVAAAPKSGSGGLNTAVVFENKSKRQIKLYWVDFGGKLKLYGTLDPGGTRRQNSYSRHTWLITDQTDSPLGYFVVSEELARAVIPPAS